MFRGENKVCCRSFRAAAAIIGAAFVIFVVAAPACAGFEGDDGNKPIKDPGWSVGSAVIFNNANRIAWWKDNPILSNKWNAEGRGDAKTVSSLLADFARIDAPTKRVVLHDGIGRSVWFDLTHEPGERASSPIDWSFGVWTTANWQPLRDMTPDVVRSYHAEELAKPPVQLDVHTGGSVHWGEVKVPDGVEVVDNRLQAHGFTTSDGIVLEGSVTDLDSRASVVARVELQHVVPVGKGEYNYVFVDKTIASAEGHWVLKHVPSGWHRIVVTADGYVSCVIRESIFNDQPEWRLTDGGMLRSSKISGKVVDGAGSPLGGVDVRAGGFRKANGYSIPDDHKTSTDADGKFELDDVPIGPVQVFAYKKGYCVPGGFAVAIAPAQNLTLAMTLAATVRVTVDFGGTRHSGNYEVTIESADTTTAKEWKRIGVIDENNATSFPEILPGKYVITGHDSKSREERPARPLTVILKPGSTDDAKLAVP